jgi:hypothetical protein
MNINVKYVRLCDIQLGKETKNVHKTFWVFLHNYLFIYLSGEFEIL